MKLTLIISLVLIISLDINPANNHNSSLYRYNFTVLFPNKYIYKYMYLFAFLRELSTN